MKKDTEYSISIMTYGDDEHPIDVSELTQAIKKSGKSEMFEPGAISKKKCSGYSISICSTCNIDNFYVALRSLTTFLSKRQKSLNLKNEEIYDVSIAVFHVEPFWQTILIDNQDLNLLASTPFRLTINYY